MKTGLLTIL